MRYLVTGGCGFIGSHLCDALIEQGNQVRVLDNLSTGSIDNLNAKAELVLGDVADPSIVKAAMMDVEGCFHLAAISSIERSASDWIGTHRVNLQGTVNVLSAARGDQVAPCTPVVYASSAAVYGDNATVPLDERSSPRPISAYGADKLASEYHARVAWLSHGVSTVGLRFFNVYGPRQNPDSPYSGVISIFIDRLRKQQPLTVYGDGGQTRDFIYVDDAVNYLKAAMESQKGEASIYNVCTGLSTSINQLAQILSMISGTALEIEYAGARSGDIAVSLGDPEKTVCRYGVNAQVDVGRGLRLTLESSCQIAESESV